ncbi:hypothetical protein SEUCBS139899_005716 [Sporothrix eucalyptigena]
MAATAAAASNGVPWMDPSVMDMFPYGQGQQIQSPSQHHQQQQMPTPGSIASSSSINDAKSPAEPYHGP